MSDHPHDEHEHEHEHEFELDDLTSEFQTLRFEVQGGVAVVTISRPDALNALNAQVLYELGAAFELAQGDLGVRALVVTGSGRAFAAGADVAGLQGLSDGFAGRESALAGQDVMHAAPAAADRPGPGVRSDFHRAARFRGRGFGARAREPGRR